jgi:glutathione S-transferase
MSQPEPLVLHVDGFWTSPYAFAAYVCLSEKGLPFEVREVNLHERAQATPAFHAKSVTARVPVLEHGGFALSESSAIVEYLEEAFAPPEYPALLPSDRRERARARQIMAWIRSDLGPLRDERPTPTIFYEPARAPLSMLGVAAAEKLIRVASAFIPDGRSTLFETFSIADADLAMMLQRLIANKQPVPSKLRDFALAQWQRPSIRGFVEHQRRPFVPY